MTLDKELIRKLKDEDGITFKNGVPVIYKTGYQVAFEGVECRSVESTVEAIKKYSGNCGVWLKDGTYYVDKCDRIGSKKKAVRVGRACKQISILRWNTMELIYLKNVK